MSAERCRLRSSLSALLLAALMVCGAAPAGHAETTRAVLENGVRLILQPEPASEVVAITCFVRLPEDASALDNATGELVARALFFGSMNRPYDSVMASVAQVGGSLRTLRTPEMVSVTCVTVAGQTDEALYLLCEALKNADFTSAALERARKNWFEERRQRESRPFDAAYDACAALLHGRPQPDEYPLNKVTPARANAYFRSRYVPSRTVFTMAGKFSAATALRAFDNYLVDYTRQPPRFPAFPPERPRMHSRERPFTLPISGKAAYCLVGTAAPSVASPDYPAFVVLQTLLGVGHASRLFRQIREAAGLGYSVGAAYQADHSDPLIAYLQWDSQRPLLPPSSPPPGTSPVPSGAQGVVALLNAQLDSLLRDPPDEDEIERARNVAIGRDALRHERVRDRAFLLGWYEAMGLGYRFDAELPRLLAAVTKEDLLRLARTYLSTRAAVVAVPR